MKYSYYLSLMHDMFIIINIISLFLIDYRYLHYNIIINTLILCGWVLNKNCIVKEYERYVACAYDNDESKCTDDYVDHSLYFHLDPLHSLWIGIMLIILFLIIRYRYKYNFIELSPYFKKFTANVFLVLINVWFAMLLIPAIHYNQKYKNIKQLSIYSAFYGIVVVCSIYYLFVQNI